MIIVTDIDIMSHGFNPCLGITQLSCIDCDELMFHTTYHGVTHTCSRTFENWLQVGDLVLLLDVTNPTDSHGIMNFTTFTQHHEKKGAFFWNLCVKVFPRFRNFSEVPTWPRDLSTNTLGI